jgi:hypothetical protein
MKFTVIQGTQAPDTPKERVRKRVRGLPKPALMVQCPRCSGREITVTLIGALTVAGKVKGGTKQYLCTACLMKGERVVVA